jgi:hypothetical protein
LKKTNNSVARRYPAIKLENKSFLETGPLLSNTDTKKTLMLGFLSDNGFSLNSPPLHLLFADKGF